MKSRSNLEWGKLVFAAVLAVGVELIGGLAMDNLKDNVKGLIELNKSKTKDNEEIE